MLFYGNIFRKNIPKTRKHFNKTSLKSRNPQPQKIYRNATK